MMKRGKKSCALEVSPHEAKDKCMVIYEFCDALSVINNLLDEGYFSHILKHQINAMGCTWCPKQRGMPLH